MLCQDVGRNIKAPNEKRSILCIINMEFYSPVGWETIFSLDIHFDL